MSGGGLMAANPRRATNPFNQQPYLLAMAAILDALHYPVAKDGTTIGISNGLNLLKPTLSFHLARAGIGPVNTPLIKKRSVAGPGMMEDAVIWVPFDAPDAPLDRLGSMTMDEIAQLPPHDRAVAMRKMGLRPDIPNNEGWVQPPNLHIDNAPESEGAHHD